MDRRRAWQRGRDGGTDAAGARQWRLVAAGAGFGGRAGRRRRHRCRVGRTGGQHALRRPPGPVAACLAGRPAAPAGRTGLRRRRALRAGRAGLPRRVGIHRGQRVSVPAGRPGLLQGRACEHATSPPMRSRRARHARQRPDAGVEGGRILAAGPSARPHAGGRGGAPPTGLARHRDGADAARRPRARKRRIRRVHGRLDGAGARWRSSGAGRSAPPGRCCHRTGGSARISARATRRRRAENPELHRRGDAVYASGHFAYRRRHPC